jgi:hypothetical protein
MARWPVSKLADALNFSTIAKLSGLFAVDTDVNVYRFLIITLAAAVFGGCAHITFHDPAIGEHRNVGVEYYRPKLYLLIVRGEKGYTAQVLTLPDTTQPRFALLHPGYGSNNLSIKLNNGMLSDVGQQVDTQVPATIAALGSLATGAGAFAKSLDTRALVAEAEKSAEPFVLYEITTDRGELVLRKVRITS